MVITRLPFTLVKVLVRATCHVRCAPLVKVTLILSEAILRTMVVGVPLLPKFFTSIYFTVNTAPTSDHLVPLVREISTLPVRVRVPAQLAPLKVMVTFLLESCEESMLTLQGKAWASLLLKEE